jgi:alpha-mannosidase
VTDLLERPSADAAKPELAEGAVRLTLRPFELVTLRLARAARA